MKGQMVIYPVHGSPKSRLLDKPPSLLELQELVGGDIERLADWNTTTGGGPCDVFVNESGRALVLSINRQATRAWDVAAGSHGRDSLVGTVVLLTGDREFMKALKS